MQKTYNDVLLELQQKGRQPVQASINTANDKIYKIDVNTRKVDVPQFISLKYDHKAEIIYFSINRYHDGFDLANTTCVVQYTNAKGQHGLYWVPYFDISHYETNEDGIAISKIVFPWEIGGLATQEAGKITFSFRFYVIDAKENKFVYNLSTSPATGEILHGTNLPKDQINDYDIPVETIDWVIDYVKTTTAEQQVYWYDL